MIRLWINWIKTNPHHPVNPVKKRVEVRIAILWDITFFIFFLTGNNNPPLFLAFADGVEFYSGKWVKDLDIVSTRTPNLYGQDGYPFKFDPKYRPLLNPPALSQDMFDRILEWARQQVDE
ncbi:MAG: hypothetical protein JXJ04_22190 [Spirochaetales bacterium]|nr:hypothetical protein [Spirochaetales bacterium]